ncbi:MAG: sigma 54-interacting transcriptional regulator [Myxococcota bacterium]|jgi:DNA-binding NtrC family response regulator|nr:sigma 54-interacting transcriptional regulator [Myxococcota bacterium]
MHADDITAAQDSNAGQLALVVWRGHEARVVPITGHPFVLGRAAPADVVVDEPTLSREHVRISPTRTGSLEVVDLQSKNGMRVRGERVARAELQVGESMEVGGVMLLLTRTPPRRAHDLGELPLHRLLAAIDEELARQELTEPTFGRTVTVAVVASNARPLRTRSVDRRAVLDATCSCWLLPELDPRAARAMLGVERIGLASSTEARSGGALVELARRRWSDEATPTLPAPNDATPTPAPNAAAPNAASPNAAAPNAASPNAASPNAASPDAAADVVAVSAATRATFEQARKLASSDRPVLVCGETGSGKELVARLVHASSPRSRGPFVPLNCGAIPSSLVESTLFGHERGAFTGATERRLGAFERANGGTLFLDEVGELAPAVQAALLRVLETGRLLRVGGTREVEVDVRLVSATHRDLREESDEGRFRLDLYHRIGVLPIRVPPLRERPEDVVELARTFVRRAAERSGRTPPRLEPDALQALLSYDWPGNVRELHNVIERVVLLAEDRIELSDVAQHLVVASTPHTPRRPVQTWDLRARLRELEVELVVGALEVTAGNVEGAAELLCVPRRTLAHKMSKLGIRRRWDRG